MGLEPNQEGRLGEYRGLQVLDFIGICNFSRPVIPRIPPRIPPQSSPVLYKSWAAVRRQEKKLKRIVKKVLSIKLFLLMSMGHACKLCLDRACDLRPWL